MLNHLALALSFDDVMLVPKYSEVMSRQDVSLSVELSKGLNVKFPVFPANMKSVAGRKMMLEMATYGGLFLHHRFFDTDEDLERDIVEAETLGLLYGDRFGFSVGVKAEDRELVRKLVLRGINIICVDVAHGHHKNCLEMVEYISSTFPNVFLIAGNVATFDGAMSLYCAGADAVKVNIGAGSTCTTRIETGNGVPMFTALCEVKKAKEQFIQECKKKVFVISDGGCRSVGDLCKALCLSDLVMTGNMFAGTEEAPGDVIEMNDVKYKRYVGSSTHKSSRVEGVQALVPYKGPAEKVIIKMREGIQSCCSYQGVSNVADLQNNPQFCQITHAGLIESHPHNVIKIS